MDVCCSVDIRVQRPEKPTVSNVEQEMANIAVLHDVVFAFYPQFTRLSNFLLTLVCFQIIQYKPLPG